MSEKQITIKLIKSQIGATKRQKRTLAALGLRKMQHTVTHTQTPQVMGMINKIQRWVEVQ